jgi:hypothetical protein
LAVLVWLRVGISDEAPIEVGSSEEDTSRMQSRP